MRGVGCARDAWGVPREEVDVVSTEDCDCESDEGGLCACWRS